MSPSGRTWSGDSRFAVLLGAIDAELGGAGIPEAAVPRSDSGWNAVLELADWHRLETVLGRQLTSAPDWVQDRLAQAQMQDLARSMVLGNARTQVLKALGEAGIPVIVLKGSALVETVYPDATWRDMGDIDLLVEPSRVEQATAVATGLGFARLPGAKATGDGRHDPKLVSADGLAPIEIHRHVLDDVDERFDITAVWARSQPSAAGTHRLAAAHDLLIHVCMHFFAGRSVRSEGALSQIRDIAWIAARGDVDWEQLVVVSRRFGVGDRVRLALAVTDSLGLLPAIQALPPLSRKDRARAEHFAASRVLTDRAHVPIGAWRIDRAGMSEFLWWGRRHLGDVPAGEMPDENRKLEEAVIGRGTAFRRAARSLVSSPVTAVRDVRIGRWLRTLR